MIDLMAWLGGEVSTVTALAKRRALTVDVEDTTCALFELSSGATGYLGTMAAAPYSATCNIYGTEANAFAAVDASELEVQPLGGAKAPRPLTPVDTLLAELDEFADACAGKVPFRVRPAEAVHSVAVMEAIAASTAAGGSPRAVGPD